MRYTSPPSSLFVENRRRLAERLKPNSAVIVVAHDVLPSNADGSLPFRQNSDLYYLTGVDQEETVFIFYPEAVEKARFSEALFLRETSELIAVWEGDKLTKERASQLTGIAERNIHWSDQFDSTLRQIMALADHIYLFTDEHARRSTESQTRSDRFVAEMQRRWPLHRYERLARETGTLRTVKSPAEIAQLQQAIDITKLGFERVAQFVQPGVGEWEIEAEFIHEFIRHKSRGFAYSPIIGSGKNACVLHYIENTAICQDGELLLLDVAAEYGNYNADLTRTIPVNGRFTPRQRDVYNAVLRVFRAGCDMLKPGLIQRDWNEAVGEVMEEELIKLRLLKPAEVKKAKHLPFERRAFRKYFMHGIGHHLGLDVHDQGLSSAPMSAGMVFTVEPGIYIREEGLAVRLENDILITENGIQDLMGHIPIEVEEIESLMASRRKK
jgi:Xaa-Pro aminopeptidase